MKNIVALAAGVTMGLSLATAQAADTVTIQLLDHATPSIADDQANFFTSTEFSVGQNGPLGLLSLFTHDVTGRFGLFAH